MPIGAIPAAELAISLSEADEPRPVRLTGEWDRFPPRLIVFSAPEFAWSAGFRGPGMTHHQAPWIFGWSLSNNVEPLLGRAWSEVIITEAAERLASHGGAYREYLARAKEVLRGMVRLEPMLWIEL